MNDAQTILPEQTYALVVGIEAYPRCKGLDLHGPVADSLKIGRWLLGRGVPAENIKVLLSSAAPVDSSADLPGVEVFNGLVNLESVTGALDKFRRTKGRFLFVFWTGHGIMTADHVRRPLLANYSDSDTHNLNLESLQEHLRSATHAYPAYQILLFDMCATLFDERLRRESLVDYRFQTGPSRLDCQQFLLYAAADRQIAENLVTDRTGLYFRELMPVLQEEQGWPPDMQSVVGKLESRFAELRSKSVTAQEPIYQYWRAPSGKAETKYLGGHHSPLGAAKQWTKIAIVCLVTSLLFSEFGLGLAPPWPNRWVVALATVPIPLLVYQGLMHWCGSATKQQMEKLLRWNLAAMVGIVILYLFLFVQFTHALPDHWHREIGGFTYTQKAQWYRDANLGVPDREIIQASGNDMEAVYGSISLALMRSLFVVCWLALFVLGSSLVSLFMISYRPVIGLEAPPPAA